MLLLFFLPSFGQIHVKSNATGLNNGSSWINAYTSLSTALQNANTGDKIWVAAGTYTPTTCTSCTTLDRQQTFTIPSGIEVLGGFPATGNPALGTRNWQTNLTILSGNIDNDGNTTNNAYSVIQTKDVNKQTILDGFTIRDGNASNITIGGQQSSGGAWYNESTLGQISHPVVRNCIFRNNFANNGAAIFNVAAYTFNTQAGSDCNMDLSNCSFLNNLANNQGGAIYNKANFYARHEGVYIDCVFANNLASFDGGAIYNNSSQNGKNISTYQRCTFTDNISSSGLGGAVYYFANMRGDVDYSMDACTFDNNTCGMYGGAISSIMSIGKEIDAVITNSVFSNNSSRAGGAIYSLGSFGGDTKYEIINCVFFKNEGRTGGAIYFNEQSNATLTASIEGFIANSIFKNNTAIDFDPLFHYSGTPEIEIQNSLVFDVNRCQDLLLGSGDAVCSGGMIYNQNPLFIDENNGDFHLSSNSPSINTGINGAIPTGISQDLDGNLRVAGGLVDMGVYERTSETADSDNDGINDIMDNCPLIANVNQLDGDGDGFGAACDCNDDPLNNGADCATNCATYYLDGDGDGFGATAPSIIACSPPNGYVNNNTDCNDADAAIFPGGPELCDNKDNNCNNTIDEGTDEDGDGVCNEDDICPVGDDNIDLNNNNIPDACENLLTLTCPEDIILTTAPGQNAVTVNWQELSATTNCTDANTEVGSNNCTAAAITDYTLIGTFNGNHYYLSENQAIWTQAEVQAVAHGGHLVVLNDAAENEFIKNAIGSRIIHIGLEYDPVNTTTTWVNGDILSYENMEANANKSTVNRYGIMNFWSGKWAFHGNYTKDYVIEVPCDGNGNGGNNGNGVEIQQIAGLANGDNFPVGLNPITYLATDACGGETTCTFNVIVQAGTSSLSLTCPPDLNLTTSSGAATAVANWNLPVVTSDCSGIPSLTLQSTLANGSAFPIGSSTVTYETMNDCGNTAICSFQVNVTSGGSNLNLTCPTNIAVTTDAGAATAPATWAAPIGTSDCTLGGATVSLTTPLSSGDLFPIGITTVTYDAADLCGSNRTCSFQVTVTSGTSTLNFTCPADIAVTTATSAATAPATWATPIGTSDCILGGATVSLTTPLASGNLFPIGITTVTYDAVDACGSTSTCSFQVTVTSGGSNLNLDCPTNISVTTDAGATTAPVTWTTPVGTSDCTLGGATISLNTPLSNGDLFPIGITTVTYDAVDACGSTSTCSFQVTVTNGTSTLNLTCPADISITAVGAATSTPVSWQTPLATSDCTLGDATLSLVSPLASGSNFPIGASTVTYAAVDACTSTSTCSFQVSVISGSSNLILTCPSDIAVTTAAGANSAIATWQDPIDNTDCSFGPAIVDLMSPLASGASFPIGTLTVMYEAVDACGSASTCSFQVIVTGLAGGDLSLACFQNLTVTVPQGTTAGLAAWAEPGSTTTCTAESPGGGISCTPTAITGFEAIGEFEGSLYYMSTNALPWPQAKIACEQAGGNLVAIESAAENNYLFSNINDMVHIGLTDEGTEGNFVWSDGTALTYDNVQSFTPNSPTNNYGVMYNWQPGKWGYVNSNVWKKYILEIPCGGGGNASAVTITQVSGLTNNSVFPIGVTTVVYQASDVCGNTASCSFTVTVETQTLACLDDTNGGIIGANETNCAAFTASSIGNISLPTGGVGTIEYLWLASTIACPTSLGEQIPGEQGPTLSPGFINQTTYFVRLSRRVSCIDWIPSNCVTKTVEDCGGPIAADYCTSNGQQPWQEWIGEVGLANLTHPSGKASAGYDDNTNLVVNLTGGQTYEVGVLPGFSYTQFNENIYVWIDFNQDNDFSDAGELVLNKPFTGGAPLSTPAFVTNNFLVPATAINGATRMRVAMKRTASTDPCESFLQGEVEDYGVFIGGATERSKVAAYLSFDAYPAQGTALIEWLSNTAATEAYFHVERSENNIDFYPIGDEQLPKANKDNFYRLEDEKPLLGDNFYRVKQVLRNGTVKYTAIKNIPFGKEATHFTLFPNPAKEELFLRIEQEIASDQVAIIQVVNLLGQVMEYKELSASELQPIIPIDLSNYKNGLYSVHLKLKKQPIRSKTFVVEKYK